MVFVFNRGRKIRASCFRVNYDEKSANGFSANGLPDGARSKVLLCQGGREVKNFAGRPPCIYARWQGSGQLTKEAQLAHSARPKRRP